MRLKGRALQPSSYAANPQTYKHDCINTLCDCHVDTQLTCAHTKGDRGQLTRSQTVAWTANPDRKEMQSQCRQAPPTHMQHTPEHILASARKVALLVREHIRVWAGTCAAKVRSELPESLPFKPNSQQAAGPQ